MSINGLEKSQRDPDVDGQDVEVLSKVAVKKRSRDRAGSKDGNFSGVGVLRSKAKRSRILVVNLVDVLVQETGVESLVS